MQVRTHFFRSLLEFMSTLSYLALALILFYGHRTLATTKSDAFAFTPADSIFLKQFSLAALPALPPAPDNAFADNLQAAKLGHKLFFDARLSANRKVSCASCHQPQKYFTDGLPRSQALGTTRRNAPSILSAAWSPWLFWDGRKDSLWSQALGPIENNAEHGITRLQLAAHIVRYYAVDYLNVFGPLPHEDFFAKLPGSASPLGDKESRQQWLKMSEDDRNTINRIFTNSGKALMAYQRQLQLPLARFDRFVETLGDDHQKPGTNRPQETILTETEVMGLRLFMGKANCVNCHNGPWFTNFEFHNIGAPEPNPNHVDLGRFEGVASLVKDEFTCLSPWSDAKLSDCDEMRFLKRQGSELVGAFKTPSLRNITATAPYMQAGQITTLDEVLSHYNRPQPPFYDPAQQPNRPHFDILPLQLDETEIRQIIAFLGTLTSPMPKSDPWWLPPYSH